MASNRYLLSEFGESITLDKPWVKSLLFRMGYVKRKGLSAADYL